MHLDHTTALANYITRLNSHSWDQIEPYVTDDVTFIFTEKTFVGKAAAKAAFEKTFDTIQNEEYGLHGVIWTAVTDSMASCHYEYRWKGMIQGQEASGGGRGTSIFLKLAGRWLIAHEHLGPYPRQS
jgi:ketosteroid isomerase-like protein